MVGTTSSGRRKAVVIRQLIFILILFSAILSPSSGQESTRLGNTDGSITIRWESLDTSYRIQVRREGQIFIDTEQTANELRLNLAPGSYEYRIHVLNPFGRDVSASEWRPLIVESTRTPYFRVQNPRMVREGETALTLSVESSLLREGTVFMLEKEDRDIPVQWQKNGNLYSVIINDSDIEPGKWDLTATDPSGMSFTHPEALIVRPTRSPEVKNLNTRELPPEGLVPVTIEGLAFDPDMTVEFSGPGGKLPVVTVVVSEGTKARVFLNLDGAEPGEYSLIVTNPSGKQTRVDNTLTISESAPVKVLLNQPRFEFQIGYAPTLIITPDGKNLPVYLGFDFTTLFQSGSSRPFFRGIGVGFRAFGGMSGPTEELVVHGIGSLDISVYYRPVLRGKTAPVFLLGIGNMWSGYAKQFEIHNILFIRTGIGLDVVNERKITHIGLDFSFGATQDTFPIISLMFRRGLQY
jgi:hypothetical protein